MAHVGLAGVSSGVGSCWKPVRRKGTLGFLLKIWFSFGPWGAGLFGLIGLINVNGLDF
ncbi:hypothetical protein F383_25282 [Gossypium arboreum]|uniref:Uncharacterized protein n=1 Tax=Gossypium arboreum TaxID=29729 RepID=A0A0B0P5N6_GOSAR|nr:hypothetical protein F383_25282 [Gossypium arboreum]